METDHETRRHRGTGICRHATLTHRIIGCAIEVHRNLGPGLFEATYEEALCIELRAADLTFQRQVRVPVLFKGHPIGEHRPDLVVSELVLVEIKSVDRLTTYIGSRH